MKTILITGANGFIGRHAERFFLNKGYKVKSIFRETSFNPSMNPTRFSSYTPIKINQLSDIAKHLEGVDYVLHLAGKAHNLHDNQDYPEYFAANAESVKILSEYSVDYGVKKFLYVSTALVHGENQDQKVITEESELKPYNSYTLSKLEGEKFLREAFLNHGLNYLIYRPPLVYGARAKGNFKRMLQFSLREMPLPLGKLKNKRSFLFIGNLLDAIRVGLESEVVNQIFLVSDCRDLSAPELLKIMSEEGNHKYRVFNFPLGLINVLAKIANKSEDWKRLSSSYCLDVSKIRKELNWTPPFTVEEGIHKTITEG